MGAPFGRAGTAEGMLCPPQDGYLFLVRKGLLDDLHLTLGGIRRDGLELILSRDHFAVLRPHTLEVDGIKLALGRADTAANALVRIDNTAAAAQAAGRLGADLLFGERHAVVLHGAHLLAVDGNGGMEYDTDKIDN